MECDSQCHSLTQSVTAQFYMPLPPSSITWYWSKDGDSPGKVTAGLAESNGSLLPGDDLKSHLRADSMYAGISSGPNAW